MFNNQYHKVKRQFKKTAKGTIPDHRIGISFAIGSFLTLLPISVFALAVGAILLSFFKSIHKLSLFLGILFWNGLVWGAIFLIPSLKVGHYLLGDLKPFATIPYVGFILTETQFYIVGISVIAIYMSILSYFVIRLIIKLYRLRLEKRKELLERAQ